MTCAGKIIGERVYLLPLDITDFNTYVHWLNDIETYIYLDASTQPIGLESEKHFIEHAQRKGDQFFAVRLVNEGSMIGCCGLVNIDHINRRAELGRVFIGEKAYCNQGYGSEGIMLLLDYGFSILNLNSISVLCCSYNQRALKSYAKCGFQPAGRYRQAKIINGIRYDEIILDILAEEFSGSPYKAKLHGLLNT